jgi:uncharacterized membrane protein YdjX (TVP38/TMEM64 family)
MRTAMALKTSITANAAAMVLAASAFASSAGNEDGIVIWGFLGFCAVILVGQLLPAIINFLTARKVLEQRIEEELADKSKLERVHAVFDRK